MEECLYPEELGGRSYFERISRPLPDWIPTADHFPILQKDGGRLRADNVRLAHRLCNRIGYTEAYGIPNAKDRAKAVALREAAARARNHAEGAAAADAGEASQSRKDQPESTINLNLGRIPGLFADRFGQAKLELPRRDLPPGSSGHLGGHGWSVQYIVGQDASGLYLEYYATNRFVWGDLRARIYANGEILDDLDTIEPVIVTRPGEDPSETERAYLERNQRVATELREAGLFPETDINAHLRTNRELGDRPEDQ